MRSLSRMSSLYHGYRALVRPALRLPARFLSTRRASSETIPASSPTPFPWPSSPTSTTTTSSSATTSPSHEDVLRQREADEISSFSSSPSPFPSPSPSSLDHNNAPSSTPAIDTNYPVRTDWTLAQIERVYTHPLLDLVYHGATCHRRYFDPRQVQRCTLLSIKTGGCPEDCKYCSQSSRYETSVKADKLMEVDSVLDSARRAREAGSTRFCMGAAWRGPSQVGPRQFGRVLSMVSEIRDMGMEVCATLGMLTPPQAKALKEAGLTAYNHNLDTSREYYPKVITSRVYQDRLDTLQVVRDAGISVCCGGIIGLGESHRDRISLLHTLANLNKHPESVPVNALVANEGTPLENTKPIPVWDLCRMIAAARIVMPATMVRLSAGRVALSKAEQALCFMAGANSIFTGDKLLTTPNPEFDDDADMFSTLGLIGKKPFFYEQEPVKQQDAAG